MAISKDMTLSDVDTLDTPAGEADVSFEMDEETFRAFYDRTTRPLRTYLAHDPRCAPRRRSAAGDVLSFPQVEGRRAQARRTGAHTCSASRPISCATAAAGQDTRLWNCPREQDLLDALASNRWPARCEEELRRHVAACDTCADLEQVAAPLKDDHEHLWSTIRVPSSGTVWWRAQTHARREAAREAFRPVTVAQALGSALAVLSLAVLIWIATPWLSGLQQLMPALPPLDIQTTRLTALAESIDLARWWWVIIAAATWLLLAPLAIYFAFVEE